MLSPRRIPMSSQEFDSFPKDTGMQLIQSWQNQNSPSHYLHLLNDKTNQKRVWKILCAAGPEHEDGWEEKYRASPDKPHLMLPSPSQRTATSTGFPRIFYTKPIDSAFIDALWIIMTLVMYLCKHQ